MNFSYFTRDQIENVYFDLNNNFFFQTNLNKHHYLHSLVSTNPKIHNIDKGNEKRGSTREGGHGQCIEIGQHWWTIIFHFFLLKDYTLSLNFWIMD